MNVAVAAKSPRPSQSQRPLIRIVIAGHVDHGKSTLIGRLLHETGALPEGKLESLKAVSKRRGMPFEWSFLLDSLQTERDQGITIDTSQIRFRTPSRDFVLIDAPGHAEFLRNMITGASQADAAILIVDAHEGVQEQTRRHGYLLHLLGVRQLVVVVNKMDRIEFNEAQFRIIETELTSYLAGLGIAPNSVIPISARHGDGVAQRSAAANWYGGPTVLEALDVFSPAHNAPDLPLRIPVQAIYKFDDRRILAGRVESGSVQVGDEILVAPLSKTARVKTIEAWPVPDATRVPHRARAGQSIGITLDRDLFVERGNVLASPDTKPARTRTLRARVFWLHSRPLDVGDSIVVRVGTAETRGIVTAVQNAIDPGRLASVGGNSVAQNHVGEIDISLNRPVAADAYSRNPAVGRVVLERDGRIVGGGLILSTDPNQNAQQQAGESAASAEARRGNASRLADRARDLDRIFRDLPAAARLARLRSELLGKITFTTSFGLEDQAITHLIAEQALDIALVTLDTGRLFPETYDVWAETERRYGIRIAAIYPKEPDLAALVSRQGINGFYASREARLACCHVRKVEPLNRALHGTEAWVTGLRAEQSAYRQDMKIVTADAERGVVKVNPIFDWSRDALLAFMRQNNVPANTLHDRGFASIGCAPCTRAIAPGEAERAGRWWWEQEGKTECGLHLR